MSADRHPHLRARASGSLRLTLLVAIALIAAVLGIVGTGASVAQTASFTFSGTVAAPSGSSVDSVVVSVVSRCWTDPCVGEALPDDEPQRPQLMGGPWQLLGETQVDSSGNWSVAIQPSWDDTYPQLVFWDRAGKLESLFYPVLIAQSGGSWNSSFGALVSEISGFTVSLAVGGRVSGHFSAPAGESLPAGDYVLTSNSRSSYYFDFALNVNAQTGEFTSPLVAPGQYRIAYGNLGDDYLNNNAAVSVEVVSNQSVNVGTIEVVKFGWITGKVTNSSGQGLSGITVRGQVTSQNAFGSMPGSPFNRNGSGFFRAFTAEDGTYSTRTIVPGVDRRQNLLPGDDWQISVEDPSGVYVHRYPKATVISVGHEHSCALAPDARIDCWGSNAYGQTAAPDGQFTALATGNLHSCAITTSGTVECWGKSDLNQIDAPDGQFTAVTAGNDFSCGIRVDQTIACWGYDSEFHNQNLQAPIRPPQPPGGQFSAISAGNAHSCGIRIGGTIACWGSNRTGQLDGIPGGQFSAISAGYHHSCGIRADGTGVCWGSEKRFRQGELDPPTGQFTAISAGFDYNCGIRTSGTVECWGTNDFEGQADPPGGGFTAITAYVNHTCGIRASQTIVCWGNNSHGQTDPATGPSIADLSVPSGVSVTVNFKMASSPSENITTPVEVIYPQPAEPPDTTPETDNVGTEDDEEPTAEDDGDDTDKDDEPAPEDEESTAEDDEEPATEDDGDDTDEDDEPAPEDEESTAEDDEEPATEDDGDDTDEDDEPAPEDDGDTDEDMTVAQQCFGVHKFGAEPVDVAKTANRQTVLAQLNWGFHESIGCYLTLDEAALAVLRAAPAPQGFPAGDPGAAQQCSEIHKFGAQPVDVAKIAGSQTVLAQVRWGFHESIGCFLALDTASTAALRAAHTQ